MLISFLSFVMNINAFDDKDIQIQYVIFFTVAYFHFSCNGNITFKLCINLPIVVILFVKPVLINILNCYQFIIIIIIIKKIASCPST